MREFNPRYLHLWPGARLFIGGAHLADREARALVGDLLHEVERLYDKVEAMAMRNAWRPSVEASGADRERSAIVKWLREEAGRWDKTADTKDGAYAYSVREAADAIERGEHLK